MLEHYRRNPRPKGRKDQRITSYLLIPHFPINRHPINIWKICCPRARLLKMELKLSWTSNKNVAVFPQAMPSSGIVIPLWPPTCFLPHNPPHSTYTMSMPCILRLHSIPSPCWLVDFGRMGVVPLGSFPLKIFLLQTAGVPHQLCWYLLLYFSGQHNHCNQASSLRRVTRRIMATAYAAGVTEQWMHTCT